MRPLRTRHTVQRIFGQGFVVFLLAFVEANVFQNNQFTFSNVNAVEVIFNQTNRVRQFVFQVVNNRQQREFFVVLAFGRTTRWKLPSLLRLVSGPVRWSAEKHGYARRWLLSVFYWYVQIRTDKYTFPSKIQIGHLNYRHGESSR